MNKRKVFGIIIILIGIIALVVALLLFNNKDKKENNNEKDNKVVEKEIEQPTIFLDTNFICGLNNDELCTLYLFNDNGDRVTITEKSTDSGMASFNNLVYYFHEDGYIHVYDASTGNDSKLNIKHGEGIYSIQVNSKYLMLLYYEETKNSLKIYNVDNFEEIKNDICPIQGKLVGEDYIYRACDEKINVYNIKDNKNTVIFDKKADFIDALLIDGDRILVDPRADEGVLIYNSNEKTVEKVNIDESDTSFDVVAFKDNIIVYKDGISFHRYDINTKKVLDDFQIDYDFYNSGYKNNKLVYVDDNVIKEFDLINKEEKELYVIDKKIVNVENDEEHGIEFETHIYNNNLVIIKTTDQGSKTDCTGGECHGTVKEKYEYYTYNYASKKFKKLDITDYREE